jgi:hypothetical protein
MAETVGQGADNLRQPAATGAPARAVDGLGALTDHACVVGSIQ